MKIFQLIQRFLHTQQPHMRTGIDDIARMDYSERVHELRKTTQDLVYLAHRYAALRAVLHGDNPRFDVVMCYASAMEEINMIASRVANYEQREGNS